MRTIYTHPDSLPVLVAGAGVAGLTAALDLARLGIPVHLVERDGHLGGQVMRLDKLYPTDQCAFCPLWPVASACREHPLVTVHRHTTLEALEPPETTDAGNGGAIAVLRAAPPAIDPDRCVFCGSCQSACAAACEAGGVPTAILPRPRGLPWDPAAPPFMVLDKGLCSRCGRCTEACPAGAVDLDRQARTTRLSVADVILATGFTEPSMDIVPEFGHGSHPDVFSAMEFETWIAECGPNTGPPVRRSDRAAARSVAFIQCAGARDQRFLPYCSSVCCMHGLKQARWVKRRHPELSCAIFFTDLRSVGKGYETYARQARHEGVLLVRSRPGLVLAAPEAGGQSCVAVRYEDTSSGRVLTAEFDLVVLNGGLAACPLPAGQGKQTAGSADGRACGFCQEPGDVAQSVIQGSRAAALVATRLAMAGGGGA